MTYRYAELLNSMPTEVMSPMERGLAAYRVSVEKGGINDVMEKNATNRMQNPDQFDASRTQRWWEQRVMSGINELKEATTWNKFRETEDMHRLNTNIAGIPVNPAGFSAFLGHGGEQLSDAFGTLFSGVMGLFTGTDDVSRYSPDRGFSKTQEWGNRIGLRFKEAGELAGSALNLVPKAMASIAAENDPMFDLRATNNFIDSTDEVLGTALIDLAPIPAGKKVVSTVKGAAAPIKTIKQNLTRAYKSSPEFRKKMDSITDYTGGKEYVKKMVEKYGDAEIRPGGFVVLKDGIEVPTSFIEKESMISHLDSQIENAKIKEARATTPELKQKFSDQALMREAKKEEYINKYAKDLVIPVGKNINPEKVAKSLFKEIEPSVVGMDSSRLLESGVLDKISNQLEYIGRSPAEFMERIVKNGKVHDKRLTREIEAASEEVIEKFKKETRNLQERALRSNSSKFYPYMGDIRKVFSSGNMEEVIAKTARMEASEFTSTIARASDAIQNPLNVLGRDFENVISSNASFMSEKLRGLMSETIKNPRLINKFAKNLYNEFGNSDMGKTIGKFFQSKADEFRQNPAAAIKDLAVASREVISDVFHTATSKSRAAMTVLKDKTKNMGEAGRALYSSIADKVKLSAADEKHLFSSTITENLGHLKEKMTNVFSNMDSMTPAATRRTIAKAFQSVGKVIQNIYGKIQEADFNKLAKDYYADIKKSLPKVDGDNDGMVETATKQMAATPVEEIIRTQVFKKELENIKDAVAVDIPEVQLLLKESLDSAKDLATAKFGTGSVASSYGDDFVEQFNKTRREADSKAFNEEIDEIAKRQEATDFDFIDHEKVSRGRPTREAGESIEAFEEREAAFKARENVTDTYSSAATKEDYQIESLLGKEIHGIREVRTGKTEVVVGKDEFNQDVFIPKNWWEMEGYDFVVPDGKTLDESGKVRTKGKIKNPTTEQMKNFRLRTGRLFLNEMKNSKGALTAKTPEAAAEVLAKSARNIARIKSGVKEAMGLSPSAPTSKLKMIDVKYDKDGNVIGGAKTIERTKDLVKSDNPLSLKIFAKKASDRIALIHKKLEEKFGQSFVDKYDDAIGSKIGKKEADSILNQAKESDSF